MGPKIVFWASMSVVAYTYLVYPAIAFMLSKLLGKPLSKKNQLVAVTVVIAAYNEQDRIVARINNLLQSDYPQELLSVVVVSDGSTDGTEQAVRNMRHERVKCLHYEQNKGKAVALNHGVLNAKSEWVIFADARQSFSDSAIGELLQPFSDPTVGAVTGNLVFTSDGTENSAAVDIDLYWRYEKAIRSWESRFDSSVGATGAIFAIRKALYSPLPVRAILDDVITPLRISRQGYRVVQTPNAIAYDIKSSTVEEEYYRKVRTLAGNYEIMSLEPWVNFPWSNRLWFQWMSHKVLRLIVPYCLVVLLIASLAADGTFYTLAAMVQIAAYSFAIIGWILVNRGRKSRYLNVFTTFFILNTAAVVALGAHLFPNRSLIWKKH